MIQVTRDVDFEMPTDLVPQVASYAKPVITPTVTISDVLKQELERVGREISLAESDYDLQVRSLSEVSRDLHEAMERREHLLKALHFIEPKEDAPNEPR